MLDTPVLLITYNRLDAVKRTFEQIRQVKPRKLYLASDGPKTDKAGDVQKVSDVREWIGQAVDWPCEVKKRFSKENQGCKIGMSSAINWVFEFEEKAIILEDDIVAAPSFFGYCQEMLERYQSDERIMIISGYKKVWDFPVAEDYFFSYFSPIWGWATWRRAWKYFDLEMTDWPQYKREKLLSQIFSGGAIPRLTDEFDKTYKGDLNSWAYPWLLTRLSKRGLGIVPGKNLIENVGYGEDATHWDGEAPDFHKGNLIFPLKHPEKIIRNLAYDREYEKRFFKKDPIRRFLRRIVPDSILNCWYRFRGCKH